MSHIEFDCPVPRHLDTARYAAELRPLGVRLKPAWPIWPSYQYDPDAGKVWKAIGTVAVYHLTTGVIAVWPYQQILDRELLTLLGSASEAFAHAPNKARGWSLERAKGKPGIPGRAFWRTQVFTGIDPADPVAAVVARDVRSGEAACRIDSAKFVTELA